MSQQDETSLQEATKLNNKSQTDLTESSSEDDSKDDDVKYDDPQTVLNKAGCFTQLSELKLTQKGEIPIELEADCLKCLMLKKYWAVLILSKAMTLLQPNNLQAKELQKYVLIRIEQGDSESETESDDDSDSETETDEDSDSETESDDDSDSETETDEDSSSEAEPKEMPKHPTEHSCPACTN